MTIGELKEKVLKLLDESRPKNDLTQKIPVFVDAGQKEVSIYAPVFAVQEYLQSGALPEACRKVVRVTDEDGTPIGYSVIQTVLGKKLKADLYPCLLTYEKVPDTVNAATSADSELEISEKAALAVVLYVAAQCNSMEYDQRFFQSFFAQYQGKLQNLAADPQGPVLTVVQDTGLPDWM